MGIDRTVFFKLEMYDRCLVDIQLAKDASYPERQNVWCIWCNVFGASIRIKLENSIICAKMKS